MKRIFLFVTTLVIFAFAAQAAQAQKVNPKLKPNVPKDVKMVKPDLKISDVQITKTADNFIEKISVTITNGCQAPATDSYLSITFKESATENAKAFFVVGNTTLAIKGGKSYTQTFDVKHKKMPMTTFIQIESDSTNKIVEDDENNNWRRLNPNSSPFPVANACQPK